MDFLNNSVYGVPLVILLAIWWMTTQLKGNNSSTQNQPTVVERIRCKNCSTPIPIKAQKCIHCGAYQRVLP
jgi:hypothetical protein